MAQATPENKHEVTNINDSQDDTFLNPNEFAEAETTHSEDTIKQLAKEVNKEEGTKKIDVSYAIFGLQEQIKSLRVANGEAKTCEEVLKQRNGILENIKKQNELIHKAIPNDLLYTAIYKELKNKDIQNLLIETQANKDFDLTEKSSKYNKRLYDKLDNIRKKYKTEGK